MPYLSNCDLHIPHKDALSILSTQARSDPDHPEMVQIPRVALEAARAREYQNNKTVEDWARNFRVNCLPTPGGTCPLELAEGNYDAITTSVDGTYTFDNFFTGSYTPGEFFMGGGVITLAHSWWVQIDAQITLTGSGTPSSVVTAFGQVIVDGSASSLLTTVDAIAIEEESPLLGTVTTLRMSGMAKGTEIQLSAQLYGVTTSTVIDGAISVHRLACANPDVVSPT